QCAGPDPAATGLRLSLAAPDGLRAPMTAVPDTKVSPQLHRAWWQHGIIYQIYPRSFQDSNGDGCGDLNGILQRLDYLHRLGVHAIWISPIYPSPMKDFGYDVADYTAIHPLFGSLDDFDRLLAETHR